MKVFISADMEGVSGVVHPEQLSPRGSEYHRGRRLQTGDANAVVAGALEAGATEVVVNDSHWTQRNILMEELHPRASLVSGGTKPLGMVQGVEGADVAVFVGYHARHGTPYAVADHTWSAACLSNMRIGGEPAGEVALNAYLCGHFGVPVAMLSGDQALEAEAKALLPDATVAVVKHATGRWAAWCLPLEESRRLLRESARRALTDLPRLRPLQPPTPCELEIELMTTEMADRAEAAAGVGRDGGRTVRFTAPDIVGAFNTFRAVMNLASLYTEY